MKSSATKNSFPATAQPAKGSQTPHDYVLIKLQEKLANQKYDTECEKPPYSKVSIRDLIDDAIGSGIRAASTNRTEIHVHGDWVEGDKMSGDKVGRNKTQYN